MDVGALWTTAPLMIENKYEIYVVTGLRTVGGSCGQSSRVQPRFGLKVHRNP